MGKCDAVMRNWTPAHLSFLFFKSVWGNAVGNRKTSVPSRIWILKPIWIEACFILRLKLYESSSVQYLKDIFKTYLLYLVIQIIFWLFLLRNLPFRLYLRCKIWEDVQWVCCGIYKGLRRNTRGGTEEKRGPSVIITRVLAEIPTEYSLNMDMFRFENSYLCSFTNTITTKKCTIL